MFFDRKWVETEYGTADFVKMEKAVKSITNQRHLARIAKKAKAYELRKTAVESLTDQKVLLAIAKNDSSDDVRVAALARVTDSHEQSLIAVDIIANGKDDYVRIIAAEIAKNRTEAQELFKEIVRKEPGICTVRAAGLLFDQDAAQRALLQTRWNVNITMKESKRYKESLIRIYSMILSGRVLLPQRHLRPPSN